MNVAPPSSAPAQQGDFAAARLLACGLALALLLLVPIRWHNYQWDFYMFYGSALDARHGVSPYHGAGLSFYHPPLALHLYGLFSHLPFPVAYQLWYSLKLASLGGLLFLWNRHFVHLKFNSGTILYFLFAYNAAIYSDLVAGNISIFEQLGLWLGFAALAQGRYLRFCLCVALISQFKLTPILFAALLLLAPARPQWKWFFACGAAFIALFSLNFVLHRPLLADFFRVAPGLDERGSDAPSTLAFIRDVFDLVVGAGASSKTRLDEGFYLAVALALCIAGMQAIFRYRLTTAKPEAKPIICFCCVTFALLAPRMKIYSDILLLVPTLLAFRMLPRRPLVPAVTAGLVAVVAFPLGASLLPFRALSRLFYEYLPLAAAFAVWLGFLYVLGQRAGRTAGRESGTFAVAPGPPDPISTGSVPA